MRLVKGADIYSAKGDKIGSLSRVVIDPNTREVSHLVVEKGLLFTSNKIIPIDRIDREHDERITLRASEQDPEEFQDFEEEHFVNLDSSEYPGEVESSYWYPPADYAWWRTGLQMATPPMPIYSVRSTQNIPDGTVALEEGARVLSADDKQVGTIEQLVIDPRDHRVTHFVVDAGFLFKERKLIPVLWISTIGEKQVHLSVSSGTLERLPAYHKSNA